MSHNLLSLLVERRKLTHLSGTSFGVADIFVFPGLKFTTGGQLHKWIFVSGKDSFLRHDFPHFRVWRSIGQEFVAVNGTYTMGQTPARSINLNVYEYTLDPPIQVMEGDFIGWEQTSDSRTRFLPLLLNNTGYELHTATHMIGNRILATQLREYKCDPLIGVQFLGKELCILGKYSCESLSFCRGSCSLTHSSDGCRIDCSPNLHRAAYR